MNVQYEYLFTLPRNILWKFIKDEKVLRNALPGCKSFTETADGIYLAEVQVNIGLIRDSFNLEIWLDDQKAPAFFRLHLKGKGTMGEISGKADFWLKERQRMTKLICKADAEIKGALALAGQQLLNTGFNKGLDTFFQKIEKEIKRSIYETRRRSK